MEKNSDFEKETQEVADEKQLELLKDKVSTFYDKNIFIISGDSDIFRMIKEYLLTLGFSSWKIKTSNSSSDIISQLRKNPDSVDLVICHLKALSSGHSVQTGLQLLEIVKNILLNVMWDKTIPFIFMEKEFGKKDIISAIKTGASQFIVLPSNSFSLGGKLTEIFQEPEASYIKQKVTKLFLEGNRLQENGLFEKAISFYNKALNIGGENAAILTEKGNALLKTGDIDEAIRCFKQATEIEENFPRAYQGLGMAYEQLDNFQMAKENYLKAIELEPDNVQVYYNVGFLYQEETDYDQAEFYFKKGIKLNNKFVRNYLGLAKNHEALEDPEEALKTYKKAIENNPEQISIYVAGGNFCLRHNLYEEAEKMFSKAIFMNANEIHLYNRLGIALRKQNKYDKAITNFSKAIKVKPSDANLRYNLAKAYYMKGEELAAINKLNKAFQMNPALKTKFEKDSYLSELLKKYPDKLEF